MLQIALFYVHIILCSRVLGCLWFTFDLFSFAFYVDKFCLVLQLDCKCYKLHLSYVYIILCSSLLGYVCFTFDLVFIVVLL